MNVEAGNLDSRDAQIMDTITGHTPKWEENRRLHVVFKDFESFCLFMIFNPSEKKSSGETMRVIAAIVNCDLWFIGCVPIPSGAFLSGSFRK